MRKFFDLCRIFVSSAWLSYVSLFAWTEPASYIGSKIIAPLTYMLFFTCLGIWADGRATASFYIIGNSMQLAVISGLFGVTMAITKERNMGTLIYLLGSPANRLAIFLGRTLFHILDGVLGVILGFALGIVLGLNLNAANVPALALTIFITTLSTCGLGLVMGSIALTAVNSSFLSNTVFFLLFLLSGANLSAERMPPWMHVASSLIPLSRGIEAARMLAGGSHLSNVQPLLLGELAIGLAYGFIGFVLFHWFELRARRLGALEAF